MDFLCRYYFKLRFSWMFETIRNPNKNKPSTDKLNSTHWMLSVSVIVAFKELME
jgi:hypothetical protein